jgi:hypothetical protein
VPSYDSAACAPTHGQAPATGPVLLTLLPASIGLTLVFASPTQTLAEIGLPTLTPVAYAPPAGLTLTSGSNVLLGPESGPLTKRDVARIFGPTFDASSNSRPSDGRMTNDAAGIPGWASASPYCQQTQA